MALSALPEPRLTAFPAVTLFISSINTRYPLELTIESLVRRTTYPNYKIVVGDNGSTDGSIEYLEARKAGLPIEVISSPNRRKHKDWLDDMYRSATTPYWFGIDSDILFLGSDWLKDMIAVFEADPDLYVLSGELRPARPGVREPVEGEMQVVDLGEVPSTWLFGVRTSLRDKLPGSDFGFDVGAVNPSTGNKQCYDVGGKLLATMREQNLRYAVMPKWFGLKYYHYGSFSWTIDEKIKDEYQAFKQYQLREIRQRISNLPPCTVATWRQHNA